MVFLEVLTRTYKRPTMLEVNIASLKAQTCQDFIHTMLNDPDGRGIAWSYKRMADYAPFLVGQYIWILDDDDMAVSQSLVADLKAIVEAHSPDVIMLKMDHAKRGILPGKSWQHRPVLGDIGCSAFVVKREIWQLHSQYLGSHYAGDFDFINSIFDRDYEIYWFDCVASRVQKISLGEPE